jgi:protocatechuate 3,4-dioxygenase beta subunit
MSTRDLTDLMDRRRALEMLGGAGLSLAAAACMGGSSATTKTAACLLSPESTEGPFYLDTDLLRSNIAEGLPGTPLVVRMQVQNADSCLPLAGAAVDVWHCDAAGVYSGVGQQSSGSPTFLRGVQMTDRNGEVEFSTIYPGWYPGRTVHIHVKVHVGSSDAYTGQLYFDEAVTDAVFATPPYNDRPGRDTTNATDSVFGSDGTQTTLQLDRAGNGYAGSILLGIR